MIDVLSECKCVMCKYFIFDFSFEHKCKAFPNGIPDDVFNNNSDDKVCKDNFKFEKDEKTY